MFTTRPQDRRLSRVMTSQTIHPGQSLREVLARAQPGDIFTLPEGVLEGPLLVDAHNVTLKAERGVRVEIRSLTDEPALITKGAVIFENLHISGSSESSPVVNVMYGRPRFKDCVIKCPGGGLRAQAGTHVSLVNCLVTDCVYGTGVVFESAKGLMQGISPRAFTLRGFGRHVSYIGVVPRAHAHFFWDRSSTPEVS